MKSNEVYRTTDDHGIHTVTVEPLSLFNRLAKSWSELTRRVKTVAGLGVIATGALVGGLTGYLNQEESADFSDELKPYVVEPGDGLWDAAEQISGHEQLSNLHEATSHIAGLDANQDVLEDGIQPGETLYVPESVEE